MSAGITSQYGFLYQRYIFIKTVLDNVGMDKYFTYEGIDDVDISEIEGINSVSISTDTFIQVKSGTVSRDCWAKMLGNWLLIDHDNPAYIVFCENKLAFTINDEEVISGVCKYFAEGKTKKSTSIANRVYKKFVQDGVDEETTFKKLITSILPKVACEVLPFDTLLEDIEESFKSVYCSDITIYEAAKNCRCNRFIEYVHSEIDSALGKKKSYTLRYQDFIRIIGKVNAEISDQKYIINISEMKKRKKTMAEALLNNDEHREIRQLRLVDSDSGFIVNELVKELLYKDFRDVYSISKDSLISNIEETAFSNYEDTVYKLSEHADARQLFWETVDKDIPLSIVGNSPIYRHGCYVYLTSDETDEERAACSVVVEHPGSKFIEEYVMPQLLLQWVVTDKDFDGIRYESCNANESVKALGGHNIVLVTKEFDKDGLDIKLRNCIKIGNPEMIDTTTIAPDPRISDLLVGKDIKEEPFYWRMDSISAKYEKV